MVTRAGKIKKTELDGVLERARDRHHRHRHQRRRRSLRRAPVQGDDEIFIGTHDGMAIRFNENGVRPMGRGAAGVKGISLREGDYVVEMDVLPASGEPVPEPPAEGEEPEIVEAETETEDAEVVASDDRGQVLTVTEKGFGKRTPVSAYRLQSRGGIGVTNIKTTDKNGKVAGISYVFEDDQVLLITEQGMIIRTQRRRHPLDRPQHAGRSRHQHRRERFRRRGA